MKEIGGYIELDRYTGSMLHEGCTALNCGRNALAYLIEARGIRKIALPWFLCDSVRNTCAKYPVEVSFYRITEDFLPLDVERDEDTWVYIVNYYGQLDDAVLLDLKNRYGKVIIDHAQDYFREPMEHTDTIYTCRKYFGVADGAFLSTDAVLERELPGSESFDRIKYVLGRFERTASEFYSLSAENNRFFIEEPVKKMSKLTENMLHAIDYEAVKKIRRKNFETLAAAFGDMNQLNVHPVDGAFMYPLLLDNAPEIRKKLQAQKIYIPVLWPDVKNSVPQDWLEYRYADSILPLPVDQRYDTEDMEYMIQAIRECL